jgi:hypothetical protein
MKKLIPIVVAAIVILSCAGGNNGSRGAVSNSFSEVIGKEWMLIEVHIDGEDTLFSRSGLPEMGRDIYTIIFSEEIVSGTGALNLYSAPYTLGENQDINISIMRSTLMAPLFQIDTLSEFNFFNYVQNSCGWALVGENLELLSRTEDVINVRLVFAPLNF